MKTLNIENDKSISCDTGDETDPLLCAMKKYSKHPSFLRTKQYFKNPTEFSFVPVDKDIPVKILKLINNIFSQYLPQIFHESIEMANFPNELKYADITTVYKKSNRHKKENYRPVCFICYMQNVRTLSL